MTRRNGYALLELLSALILLTAFAVISTRLFSSTVKLSHNLGQAHDEVVSVEFALAAMRDDVAAAARIECKREKTATLTTADEKTISWTINEGRLVREAGDGMTHCRAPAAKTTFATDGVTLILKIDDPKPAVRFGEIWMSSQAKLIVKLTQ
jgi:hypothetical protein